MKIRVKDIPLTKADRESIEKYKNFFHTKKTHDINFLYDDIKKRGVLKPIGVFSLISPLREPHNIDRGLSRITCCELLGIEEVEIELRDEPETNDEVLRRNDEYGV